MFVTVNDNELYVEVLGADAEDAPTMIVHHGAPGLGSHAEPKAAFGPFADVLRIVVFDARGSGWSGLRPPFTHDQWAADINTLRAHFGLERVVMAGGSYGGFIAMEYAIRHPDRVRALILRDTAADHSFDDAARENARRSSRVQLDQAKFERIFNGTVRDDADLEDCWREILPLYDYDYDPARVEEKAAQTIYHAATHNYAFTHNMPSYDITARIPSIRCPTLVVVGRHDWITPVAASERIAGLIPGARLEVFERSGHAPQLEEPERFQAVVRDFLASAGVIGETARP